MRNGVLSFFTVLALAGFCRAQDRTEKPSTPKGEPREVVVVPAPLSVSRLPPTANAEEMPAGAPSVPGMTDDEQSTWRLWLRGEYLLWWVKPGPLPAALVTTGSAADETPGAIGQPGTRVLFGGPEFSYPAVSGTRWTLGAWLDPHQATGLEISGFTLGRADRNFSASTEANHLTVLGFPHLDRPTAEQDVFWAAVSNGPGPWAGSVAVHSTSQLWGLQANVVGICPCGQGCCDCCGDDPPETGPAWARGLTAEAILGVCYLNLDEGLDLGLRRQTAGAAPVSFAGATIRPPAAVLANDSFRTRNQFYGGQFGGRLEYLIGKLIVEADGRLALGQSHEVLAVAGNSQLQGSSSSPVSGGLFAVASNGGRETQDVFRIVPEVEVKVGCQVTQALRASAGYDFLYWSEVVRPGSQIDRNVATQQVPTDPTFNPTKPNVFPQPKFEHSDFWAQGLTLSLEYRY